MNRLTYTCIMCVSCATLFIMSILIRENDRFTSEQKKRFYHSYLVLVAAALAEWCSVMLNGGPEWTIGIHTLIKGIDYALTPIAALYFIRQVSGKVFVEKSLWILMGINVVLELTSAFTGWIYYVDSANYYHHGPYYFLYFIVYAIAIVMVLAEFRRYGRSFRKQNIFSLYIIILFVVCGIVMQEFIDSSVRIIYLVLSIGSVLLFTHYNEYSQIKMGDDITYQQKMLETDTLTRLLSRYSYAKAMESYRSKDKLPEDLVVFVLDVNSLKETNDTLGHEAGDNLIVGAAYCISKALESYGSCYRVGGDEFVAIVHIPADKINHVVQGLRDTIHQWHGTLVNELSISVGYCEAHENPDATIDMMIETADQRMFDDKAEYYRVSGKDRRKHRGDNVL